MREASSYDTKVNQNPTEVFFKFRIYHNIKIRFSFCTTQPTEGFGVVYDSGYEWDSPIKNIDVENFKSVLNYETDLLKYFILFKWCFSDKNNYYS